MEPKQFPQRIRMQGAVRATPTGSEVSASFRPTVGTVATTVMIACVAMGAVVLLLASLGSGPGPVVTYVLCTAISLPVMVWHLRVLVTVKQELESALIDCLSE